MTLRAQNSSSEVLSRNPLILRGNSHRRRLFAVLATFAVILAAAGLSSCSGYTNAGSVSGTGGGGGTVGDPAAGVLSANSTSLSFGSVAVGSTGTQSVTVTNTGTSTVNISSAAITGAAFTVIGGNPASSVPVGQSITVQIQFAPTTNGAVTGSLTVTSDASNSPLAISLSGTGTQPALTMSPTSLNFSNVTVGQTSTQPVTLTNSGNSNLVINLATISGTGFGMSGLALPKTITAGQNISFNVQFSPTSTTGVSGNILFTDNAPGSPQTLTMTGSAVASGSTLSVNPGSFNFNSVVVGNTSPQTFTLTNTGNTTITINSVSTTGSGFSTIGLAANQTIAAGATASFTARFAPTTTGALSGVVTITSSATNPTLTIPLSGTGTQGTLVANPSPVSFGSLVVGTSGSVPVTLSNTGTAPVSITAHSITGTGFTLTGWAAPASLSPGQTTSFTVTYSPTSAGNSTGSVSISSNAPASPLTINLSGSGTATQAQMTIAPPSLTFTNISVGGNSTQNVTLTNTGNASLNITAASITGAGYTMNLTAPRTINAGAISTFTVTFTPTSAAGAPGSISITSNAPGSPATIPLSGTGAQAQISASPTGIAFPNVAVGSNSSQPVTLRNNGNATLTFSKITMAGTGMSITGLSTLTTIAAGGSMTFNAIFTPTSATTINGSVTLTTNGTPSPMTINLSGTGTQTQAQITASPTSVVFSNVVVGNSNSQPIILHNAGNATLTFSTIVTAGTGMSITGLSTSTTIAAGASVTFNAVFTPANATTINGSVKLTTNGTPSPLTISLSGTGVAATHVLAANPTSLSFGTVNVNGSNQLTSTLTNTGNSSINVSGVTTTGAGFSASGVSNTTILTPGQSATLTVTFAPTTSGAVSGASVKIASNATGSPTTITLSGTGQAAASHSVALTWNASPTAGVSGYNVFRATTSGGYGTTPLNPSPVSALTYTDTTVASGQGYFYVVEAVAAGVSSTNSNEVPVTIP